LFREIDFADLRQPQGWRSGVRDESDEEIALTFKELS